MIKCTTEKITCECGNDAASKFSIFISKKRILVNGKHSDETTRYIRCTICSDMITQEEMNKQLEEPLVTIKKKRSRKLTENGMTPKQERKILAASEEVKRGINVSGPFSTAEETIEHLNKLKKK